MKGCWVKIGHKRTNQIFFRVQEKVMINYSNIFCFQNVLRELEQKKPQLDDLVKTAENLRESPIRQQIPEKGRKHFFFFLFLIVFVK